MPMIKALLHEVGLVLPSSGEPHHAAADEEWSHTPCVGIVFKASITKPDGRDSTKTLELR